MFTAMISALREGRLPGRVELAGRLGAALVKKLAVLRQPYHCRTGDPKINPPATHLLWAAIILGDRDRYDLAAHILVAESEDSPSGREKWDRTGDSVSPETEILDRTWEALLDLVRDTDLADALRKKRQDLEKGDGRRASTPQDLPD